MTSLWKTLTAIAALVFLASGVWLVVELLNGDGVPLLAVGGLIVAASVLLLTRVRWLGTGGFFYEEIEDDEDTETGAAPSAPVSRGWGGSFTGPNAASGGEWQPSPPSQANDWPRESVGAPPPPHTAPVTPPSLSLDDLEMPTFLRPRSPSKAVPLPAAPEAPAGADERKVEQEVAEEAGSDGRDPSPEDAPVASAPPTTPEPESEPIPAAVGSESAEKTLFSAYYPREVKPGPWQPLRAYMFRASASQAVQADALAQFGARADIRATAREALQPVPEDALVTAIPSLPGFEFDPPQVSLRFRGDWRRFDFEFQAAAAPLDTSTDGHITFLVEGVIVADVPLSVYVSLSAGESALRPQVTLSEPYQAIFCSYSHEDTAIVERVERASRYFNFRYLRDVTTLRSGEMWNARLLELIDSADIFQLFWSKHAAASDYVRQEYQYAEALRRKGAKSATFIRPIRWEEPMPAPAPPELSELHFDLIPELAAQD